MKKLLVTGSLGLVGSACMELFAKEGWNVYGIDNNGRYRFFGTPSKEMTGFTQGVDIRDQKAVNETFEELGPFDAIIHTAGQPSHDYSTDHVLEDFDVNARGTIILLEATRKYCPEAVFVHVSTDKVYGENMSIQLHESETRYEPFSRNQVRGFDESLGLDFAGDRSFFGCSKAAADMYAQQYAVRGMKVGIFRPGCITGRNHAGSELHGFLAYMALCIREGKTYKIFGNGKNVRDQIHANDLAEAFFEFVRAPKSGASIFNFGGGPSRSVSILEAGEMLSKAIGKPFLHEFHEARKGDRLFDVHDISKFRRDYPEWGYSYELSDIIADLV